MRPQVQVTAKICEMCHFLSSNQKRAMFIITDKMLMEQSPSTHHTSHYDLKFQDSFQNTSIQIILYLIILLVLLRAFLLEVLGAIAMRLLLYQSLI